MEKLKYLKKIKVGNEKINEILPFESLLLINSQSCDIKVIECLLTDNVVYRHKR